MGQHKELERFVKDHPELIGRVVDFDAANQRLFQFDFTDSNRELSSETIADTNAFSEWVTHKLSANNCRYGIGGYFEHRTLYARSALFNTADEPRRLHLGVDIWAAAGTMVYAPLDGKVHSFKDNNHFGDYGPTIILEHNLDGLTLFTLYGHLNRASLNGLYEGMPVQKDQPIARFGTADENGNWPPHLHFQLMFDMQGWKGDYPGACRISEREIYLQNIPNPDLILQLSANRIIM